MVPLSHSLNGRSCITIVDFETGQPLWQNNASMALFGEEGTGEAMALFGEEGTGEAQNGLVIFLRQSCTFP